MKTIRFVLILLALSLVAPWQSAKAADVICYNCPPEWADWASMLKAIKADLNYDIPHDNKNSGQALAQILAEKNNPVGDIGYFGVTFGMKAKAQDALEPYKPANWDQVAPGLKDPDGYWTTIHSGTLGLFVNKDALAGKPVPACWKDLLKPDYKGMVGYLDPTSAAPHPISIPQSPSSRSCARTIRSFPSRHLMPEWFPARCRSCWIMISTPIARNIQRRGILSS
jgi:putative spermidine/putrescine transport system substrate-binding protein